MNRCARTIVRIAGLVGPLYVAGGSVRDFIESDAVATDDPMLVAVSIVTYFCLDDERSLVKSANPLKLLVEFCKAELHWPRDRVVAERAILELGTLLKAKPADADIEGWVRAYCC